MSSADSDFMLGLDEIEAEIISRRDAADGLPSGRFAVGRAYLEGRWNGSEAEGVELLTLAAQQGHKGAMLELAMHFQRQAMLWTSKAASREKSI